MATNKSEELYNNDEEEIVGFGLKQVNRQKSPISPTELKVQWDEVCEMNGMIMIRTKLTEIPWNARIHRMLPVDAFMS